MDRQKQDLTRRTLLKRAAYTAPDILGLKVTPLLAAGGSDMVMHEYDRHKSNNELQSYDYSDSQYAMRLKLRRLLRRRSQESL